MSLRYEGTYNYDGFQLVYFQADPGKPVLWDIFISLVNMNIL